MNNPSDKVSDDLADLKALFAQLDRHMDDAKGVVRQNKAFLDRHQHSLAAILKGDQTPPSVEQV
jgi:hypothetical protein